MQAIRGLLRCARNDAHLLINPESLATIKILADCDQVQGSLAVAIADFLMIGEKLAFKDEAYSDKPIDIVYENCSKCSHVNKSSNRFYINVKEHDNETTRKEDMINLLANRNIVAVKIKPVMYRNNDWLNYGDDLLQYLKDLTGYRTYTKLKDVQEITIYDKKINGDLLEYVKNVL